MPSVLQLSPLPSRLQTLLIKLRQKKYRIRFGQYTAEGLKTVQDSLRFGARAHFFVVREDEFPPPWVTSAPIYTVPSKIFNKLSALETPSGLIAVFSTNPAPALESLRNARCILVLEGLSDPGNVGTLLRTAHWFGFRHVVLSGSVADPYNPKAVQAAMGSLPALQLYFLHTAEVVSFLRKGDYAVFLAVLERGTELPVLSVPSQKPRVLVLGSESHGLSEAWLREAFHRVFIPPADSQPPDSLNVALAGAILMQHLAQAR